MSAFTLSLNKISAQILMLAPHPILAPASRQTAAAILMTAAALSAAPGDVAAQSYGYGYPQPPTEQSPLPQQSAGRWGETLGGVVGRSVGVALGGSAGGSSPIGRGVQDVLSGVGQEVGRNVGRSAAQSPYRTSSAGAQPVTLQQSDQLDTLALRAVFANERAARYSSNVWIDAAHSSAANINNQAFRLFEGVLRQTAQQGGDVRPWLGLRDALSRPVRTVPESQFAELAQPAADRLNRIGGPGFQVNGPVGRTLGELRESLGHAGSVNSRYSAPTP